MKRTDKTTKVKVIRSTIGSSIHIPSVILEERKFGIGLEAPYDHWAYLPPGWESNPYLIDEIESGRVETGESDGMPKPAVEIPGDLDSAQREWVRTLCHGEYTEQFRVQLRDWKNSQLAAKTSRRDVLTNRVKPMCESAVLVERQIKHRADLLADLESVVEYIENESWRRNV